MRTELKTKLIISLLFVSLSALTGCSDSGSKSKVTEPATYHNPLECQNQAVPVGIPGNTACPYQGAFDPSLGYQPYSIQYQAGIGAGFLIDFGWQYRDLCPQDGQLSVFENGEFSHCSDVNPYFAGPFQGYTNRSMAECAGEQYSIDLTGCRAELQPTQPVQYW